MLLVKPEYKILTLIDGLAILCSIERAGRTCYKSESKIDVASARVFCKRLIDQGHLSVIEHESVSVHFTIDRGVSHELVRHRLASYSQESTRYCDYSGSVTFVIPPWVEIQPGRVDHRWATFQDNSDLTPVWINAMLEVEKYYERLRQAGWSPQQARSVLPNSLKTEIVCTANIREWRHILALRTAKAAHPQMREIMRPLLAEFRDKISILFDDVGQI